MKTAHKDEKAALENKIKELELIIATKGAKD